MHRGSRPLGMMSKLVLRMMLPGLSAVLNTRTTGNAAMNAAKDQPKVDANPLEG